MTQLPGGVPGAAAGQPKTSGMAIASLVCGLLGLPTCGLGAIVGFILGLVALSRISKSGGTVGGRGLAIAGTIISVVSILFLVVALMGAALLIPRFAQQPIGLINVAPKADIASISVALETFEVDCGRYPTTEEGLKALVAAPADVNGWHGPYLKHEPHEDPWGMPYVYRCPGLHNTGGFDLYSLGPDMQEGGGDDITNWSK